MSVRTLLYLPSAIFCTTHPVLTRTGILYLIFESPRPVNHYHLYTSDPIHHRGLFTVDKLALLFDTVTSRDPGPHSSDRRL